jgi:hypothetical protein
MPTQAEKETTDVVSRDHFRTFPKRLTHQNLHDRFNVNVCPIIVGTAVSENCLVLALKCLELLCVFGFILRHRQPRREEWVASIRGLDELVVYLLHICNQDYTLSSQPLHTEIKDSVQVEQVCRFALVPCDNNRPRLSRRLV